MLCFMCLLQKVAMPPPFIKIIDYNLNILPFINKKMSRSIQIFYLFMYLGSASAALRGASSSKCPVSDIDYQNALSVQEKILNRLESDADQFESMLYTHCFKASIKQFHREYTRHLEESILLQMERKR